MQKLFFSVCIINLTLLFLASYYSSVLAGNLDNIASSYTVTTGENISLKPICGDYLTANQTTVVPGKFGNARYFSGSGENLTASDNRLPSGNSPFSITLWFKTNKAYLKSQYGVLLSYGLSEIQKSVYLGVGSDSNNVQPDNSLFVGPHGDSISSKIAVNDDQWHHAGATFDGLTWNLYLDGILKNTKIMPINITKQGVLTIGSANDGTLPWKGYLDEIHFYAKPLQKREIAFDMNQEKLNDLIGAWRMDENDISPIGENFLYESSDSTNWLSSNNVWSFSPFFNDGGTIKNINFSCTSLLTNQKYTKSTKIVVFRDYSKLKKYSHNPIIDIQTAPWNSMGADAPYIHNYQQINGTFYAPVQVNDSIASQYNWYDSIAIYKSQDLLNWTPVTNNPVIIGQKGGWDDHFLLHPSIIKIGNLWHMYYSAMSPNTSIFGPYSDPNWGPEQIGLATSPDLINWAKYSNNPVYSGETPNQKHQTAAIPSVIQKDNNSYLLYYHDRINDGTKIAQSADGIHWNYLGIALMAKSGDWDHRDQLETSISYETGMDPFIIKNANGYYEMVYAINYHNTQKCGTALSDDGINWYKYQNPILTASNIPGSYDEHYIGDCLLLDKGNQIYLYYAGVPTAGYKSVNFDVGLGSLACLEPDGQSQCFNALFSPTPSPTPTQIPCLMKSRGNLDCNNTIDIFDYNILVLNFGAVGAPGWMAADLNPDSKIDIFDYNILVSNFGTTQ